MSVQGKKPQLRVTQSYITGEERREEGRMLEEWFYLQPRGKHREMDGENGGGGIKEHREEEESDGFSVGGKNGER